MKKFILTSLLIIIYALAISQTPGGFNYQAVVRNSAGEIIQNQTVAFRITLLQGGIAGTAVYIERHTTITNQYGLVNLDIGFGTVLYGVFANINWSAGQMFMTTEIDLAGGTNYQLLGTTQLLSVPYALHSKTSEKFPNITDEERDALTNVSTGTSYFNLTTNKINYFDGIHWNEVNSDCLPKATLADAGFDHFNIAGATINLQANTPVIGTGQWIIKSGTGGSIADIYSPSTVFSGLAGSTYTLSWKISNDCGFNSDDVVFSFAPFVCGTTFKDIRDNKIYPSVLIGSQCWMAANMNVGTMIEGSVNQLDNNIIEKYCNSNLESNCDVYGGIYTWYEVMQYSTAQGSQGICAPGWHIPTDNEWKILEGTVDSQYGVGNPVWDLIGDRGSDAGGNLKETGTTHWVWPNTGATNSSGFTALPGGSRNTDGSFPGFQIFERMWTSNENGTTALRRALSSPRADISRDYANKFFGFSVRCIKN
jgi:uncharacterized protein (TIGR02145 family)